MKSHYPYISLCVVFVNIFFLFIGVGCERDSTADNKLTLTKNRFQVQQDQDTLEWSEICSGNAYAAYKEVRNTIIQGSINLKAEECLNLVFVNEADRKAAMKQLARLSGDKNQANEALRSLHEVLMRTEPNRHVLYAYLKQNLKERLQCAEENPKQRVRSYAWGLGYLLESALTAYESTNDVRFLDLAKSAMLEVLKHRDDVYGWIDEYRHRILKSWGSEHIQDNLYTSVVTHAGRIVAPMARFAWIVKQNRSLREKYEEAAYRFQEAAQAALIEYDDEFHTNETEEYGYYWRLIDDRIEPLNHQAAVGKALLYLSEITEETHWKKRAEQLSYFFRKVMYREINDTIVWNYSPMPKAPQDGRPTSIWKAHVTCEFLVHAERLNLEFSQKDIEAIGRSFRINVLRDDGQLNANFAKEFIPLEKYRDQYGGFVNLVPYFLLGKYDKEVEVQLFELIAKNPDLGGWFGHHKSTIAYAYRLGQYSEDDRQAGILRASVLYLPVDKLNSAFIAR